MYYVMRASAPSLHSDIAYFEKFKKMVVCCRCNRTGQCRGCACVKAGKSCSNCLPSRLGNCSNVSATTNANTDTNTDTANRDVSALSNTSISTISTATASTSPSSSPVGPAVSSSGVASIHDTQNQPSISFHAHHRETYPHHYHLIYPHSYLWQLPTSSGVMRTRLRSASLSGMHMMK